MGANGTIYQFWCDDCQTPYEIQMKLAELEEYDKGDEDIDCPNCEKPLTKLICPPRRIYIH